MALTKQNLNISFTQGVDTKTDPFQIDPGKFLSLTNTVFTETKLLKKRNGFGTLTTLPNSSSTYITTFNGNLTAIGNSFQAFSANTNTWLNKGSFQPVSLSVLPLVRSSINQSYADAAFVNGLVCVAYQDDVPSGGSTTPSYKYAIFDEITGQNIVPATIIVPTAGTVTFTPKVFVLNNYFIVMFDTHIGSDDHLEYIAISSQNPSMATPAADISSNTYTAASTGTFDAVTMNNFLYIAWNGNDNAIHITSLSSGFILNSPTLFSGNTATQVTLGADAANNSVYIAFYDTPTTTGKVAVVDSNLNKRFPTPATITTTDTATNLTVVAQNQVGTIFLEDSSTYGGSIGSVPTNLVKKITVTQTGSVGSLSVVSRSVGLASKAFIISGIIYILTTYQSPFQNTYFLMDLNGNISAKLAYENGGGYLVKSLPNATVNGSIVRIPYLVKDLITSVNKGTNLPSGSQTAGVYSQTGINTAYFDLTVTNIQSVEIGSCLNISGGFLWQYDGVVAVEQNFFLYPDSIAATWSATGGSMAAKPDGSTNTDAYFYQVCYEWEDNSGNVHRSAPSIPVPVTTTGSATTGSVAIQVPTLRLTYKTNVQIVIYRWSVAQQAYYRVTGLAAPTLSNKTTDSIVFTDTLPDSAILGNTLLYTTGGVLEDTGTPAVADVSLFDSRLFMIDGEDRNLLFFSKQVIENTPVEMSDLLTKFIPPTTAAQGSTGPMHCTFPMDDKLIIFKQNALYYMNGSGPDNTGANSQYSDPIIINATVGCTNKASIVLTPLGLLFQTDSNGIWLVARDLSTRYIGAPVEAYNSFKVTSAINTPNTTQVRFTLTNGICLMYDYYYDQWGTFSNVSAISSTIYNNSHTFLNSIGKIFQETPGKYLDGTVPVLIGFITGWFNLMGLQGFQRAYFFYLMGTYLSAHKLSIGIAYDYAPTASQTILIQPDNFNLKYGDTPGLYGSDQYGGNPTLEQWRIFFSQQKCQSFQLNIQEISDLATDPSPSAGLTISGLNLVLGAKKSYLPISASRSVG